MSLYDLLNRLIGKPAHLVCQALLEWKAKLEEAIGLRKVAEESTKLYEVEALSVGAFSALMLTVIAGPLRNNDGNFAGKVACSIWRGMCVTVADPAGINFY
jgi:hypothetical protein